MNNIQDVRIVLQKKLQHVIKAENREDILEKLVLKCEGLMLYAHFLILAIEENPSVLDKDLDDGLPLGISSVYSSYFKRLESELLKEDNVKEENFLNLLYAITASREPLPIDFVSRLLLPGEDSLLAKRRLLKALGTVSSLLPIRNGCLHVIHKSVEDWLTDSSCYGEHDFIVEEKQGHRILASLCTAEFDELKQKGVHNVQFSATEKYALCHSAWHMFYSHKEIRRDRLEELTKAYVTDLELLFAKLCVGSAIAAEDVIWFQKQGISSLLSEDIQSILNTLKHLLRKYHDIFTSHPHLFWQNVLNEGGAVLSGEASNLLQKKYPEIPYMEYIHKDSQQGGVLARFQCFEEVVCFDVSSNLDYMVCECKDGVLYLWSLQTARLLWTRPVQVPKGSKFLPFRTLPSSSVRSCYRSVVFHPTEDLVLPGILSHAYTTEGDLKPLFVESSCRFSVCSVSGDKTEVLTNCLDDAKCLRMWSLKNGAEVARITRDEDILSFARSQDGSLLAISHLTGSICLLDVMSDFTILAETTAPEVREMLKFSPDNRVLFCVLIPDGWFLPDICAFHVNVPFGEQSRISLIVPSDQVCYDPKKFDFVSDRGFLLGDPIPTSTDINYFVLDKYTALTTSGERKYCIDMVSTDKVAENSKGVMETRKIALSSDGETVYVVVSRNRFLLTHLRVVAWDVSSGKLIAKKNTGMATNTCLVCVTEGILLETSDGYLELWRADLSECIRRWTNLSRIRKVIPVSEERVACITEGEVTVLDTTSGNILSRIPALHNVLACNSKLQILTTDGAGTYLLYDGTSVFWKRKLHDFSSFLSDAIFSPTEQFVIIYHQRKGFILDAVLGNTLYTLDLLSPYAMKPLRFISSENYVVAGLSSVRFYNVKFGDLLSEMNIGSGPIRCLAVCPSKRLLAIGVDDRNHRYKVIRVWLPGDKESRKS